MSLKRMSAVWDESKASGSTLLLLLAIADNASDDGLAWPGIETLVKRSRLGKRAVIKQLKHIEGTGELRIYRRAGQHNYYIVDVGLSDEQRKAAIEVLSKKTGVSVEKITGELCAPVNDSTPTGEPQFTSTLGSGEPQDTTTGEPQDTRSIIGTVNKDRTVKEPKEIAPAAQESPTPPRPDQALFGAICDAFGFRAEAITKTIRGKINTAVGELLETNATPEDMASFKMWLDAHAQKNKWGEFTVSAMPKYWTLFDAEHHAPAPAPLHIDYGDQTQDQIQDEIVARFRAKVAIPGAFDDRLTPEERAAQDQQEAA